MQRDSAPPLAVHEMQIARMLESGACEWFCQTCGRRVRMRSELDDSRFEYAVLCEGDRQARHVGGNMGVSLAAPTVNPARPQTPDKSGRLH